MRIVSDLTVEVSALEKRRNRLREAISFQERLLGRLRGEIAEVRRDRLTEATEDFNAQLEALEGYSPYWVEKHAALIERLRSEIPERPIRRKNRFAPHH